MVVVWIDIPMDSDDLLTFILKNLKNIQFGVDITIPLCYTDNRSSE